VSQYWPHVTALVAVLDVLIVLGVLPWVLLTKRDSTAAIAWCLVVILMPLFGTFLFWVFGYNHVYRPLRRKRAHRLHYGVLYPPAKRAAARGEPGDEASDPTGLGHVADQVDAFALSQGNHVTVYRETREGFEGLVDAIRAARSHIHLEYYIVRTDVAGRFLLSLLADRAKAGVEVRFVVDSLGGFWVKRRLIKPLLKAGGQFTTFLPLNPLRSRIQVNMRNHRKIAVVDGAVAFTGGMNIGDEYLGPSRAFPYWRDQVIRVEGPAVAGLQRIFCEDWNFATHELLDGPAYFPDVAPVGNDAVQVIESGPDQAVNSIRAIYFAAIVGARERLWIASPYCIPDAGLQDALRLAACRGVDVRLLCPLHGDHFLSHNAGRYYLADLSESGIKVYLYKRGMMHSMVLLVDGKWASVGSANLDNRSLHLNFEANCLVYTQERVAELEEGFRRDLEHSVLATTANLAGRTLATRLKENGCRLLAPVL
jgi:cardiolipin synthase